MNRTSQHIFLVCIICILTAGSFLSAQEHQVLNEGPGRGVSGHRRQIVLDINARVLQNEQAVWYAADQKITISGAPVSIQLENSNLKVVAQFTPYIRRNGGNVLVAQVQIYTNNPDQGVNYYTSMQIIPMEFDEPIYFFPLGRPEESSTSSIEIILTVTRYRETANHETDNASNND